MYRVVAYFEDLQDNNHPYKAGDIYPRKGYKPAKERIIELSGTDNKRGIVLIRKIHK
ncbi:hypothetical protein [Ruminococcus sp.]|uniref:hypothetical protein n=1 Tax=Ruminococcus sp. TaxID=41978 RepID=UPI001B6BD381|nr:hypothetical protein [Ruminococcus sp.]MBP5431611.1 hypothetical protein [Ruminococcus sp.]